MSENIPLYHQNKLKLKKRFRFFNKSIYKNTYENYKQKIYKVLFFISLIGNILSFFYILYIKRKILKENNSSTFIPPYVDNINNNSNNSNNRDNNEFPVLKLSKDELLEMCYKSRAFYYKEERKRQTSHILDNYHNQKYETIQYKITIILYYY